MFPTQTQGILNLINRLSHFYAENVVTNYIVYNLHMTAIYASNVATNHWPAIIRHHVS